MLKNAAMKGSNHQVGLVQLINKNPNKQNNQPEKKNLMGLLPCFSFFNTH